MCKMIDQYADKIKGTFSFFDRMIINGYIRPLFFDHERDYGLYKLGVLYKDFMPYVMNVTEPIKSRMEDSAIELGRPVKYLNSSKIRKEDVAKSIMEEDSVDEGLICVILSLCHTGIPGRDGWGKQSRTRTLRIGHSRFYTP